MTLEITIAGRAGEGKTTTAYLIKKLLAECGMLVEHQMTDVEANELTYRTVDFNFEALRGKKIKLIEKQLKR